MKRIEEKHRGYILSYENPEKIKDEVFNRVLGWFKEYDAFCGETVMQSDTPQIESAPFLSELADDVFKFKWGDIDD